MIKYALGRLIAAATLLVAMCPSSWGQSPACTRSTIESLIDDLAHIDRPVPGVAALGLYEAFVVEDNRPRFAGGVLGATPPSVPPQMRDVARCGVEAVPALIQHLNDARPTRFVVGEDSAKFHFLFRITPRNTIQGIEFSKANKLSSISSGEKALPVAIPLKLATSAMCLSVRS